MDSSGSSIKAGWGRDENGSLILRKVSTVAAEKTVIIIGGGIGGLTLALALRQRGVEARVYEKYDHFQNHRTGFLIWSYAIKILERLGVPVSEDGAALEVMEIYGAKGQFLTSLPVGEVSRESGADSYEINRLRLISRMSQMVGEQLHMGKDCISIEMDAERAVAHFSDKSQATGDIIVGCDGAKSTVRTFIQPTAKLEMFNAGGWIAVIDQHPADLKPGYHLDFWEPSVKGGVADIGNGEARWYVGMNGRLPESGRSIKEQILDVVPVVPTILNQCLELTSEDQMVPVIGGDLLTSEHWYRERAVLLGDAAHATSPYAGMGACSAIADAFLLSELLATTEDWPAVFESFENGRKPAAESIIKESRKNLHLSTGRGILKNKIRDWKLGHIPEKAKHQIVSEMVNGR